METDGRAPTLDRLFRHMAWANAHLIAIMQDLPSSAYQLSLPNDEWTIVAISEHLVSAAGGYAAALDDESSTTQISAPTKAGEFLDLAVLCASFDARLRDAAKVPDAKVSRTREGVTIYRARSTILGQSIHHATEHRAQIASILSLHQVPGLDLDELDLWAYSDAEGLGD